MIKWIISGTFVMILALGAYMYYLQVYANYEPVAASNDEVQLTSIVSGEPEPIIADDFEGIDAYTSPIRYRACFTTPMSLALLSETYVSYDAAVPLLAPKWFDCFDAKTIGADLEEGIALPFLSEAEIKDGVDRVMAVYPDGRAYVWHQLNAKYSE